MDGPTTLTGVYWHQGEANTAPSACEVPDGAWLRSLSKAECLSSPEAGADGGEMGCKMRALSRFVGVDRLANLGSITIADKPLIVNLGERRVIILGLMVNVSFFLG